MEIASSAIIGAIISIIVQKTKKKFGTNRNATILTVISLSLVVGIAYYFLEGTKVLESIIQIISFAGAIYTFIIKQFEK